MHPPRPQLPARPSERACMGARGDGWNRCRCHLTGAGACTDPVDTRTGPRRYARRHVARDSCDAAARYFLHKRTEKLTRAMSAREARPPNAAPVGGRVRRTYERGGITKGGQDQRGRPAARTGPPAPRPCAGPLPTPLTDAHDGKPSRTRPDPWPLPPREAPRGVKRAGSKGSRGLSLRPSPPPWGRAPNSLWQQAPVAPRS